ncbi:MAG TPA: cellulase family glycosylhydrolase [Steroidobacteraceae bacterium]|nr:cellulase family glycosylhydrolase [Steroidobacteraceae bacterium]
MASQINLGWNIGNTLEAQCGETAWGNPPVSQTLINAVKQAGFNAVRIPAAWDCHASNGTIDPNWMARVKQVVDYAYSQNMYVILNIHWDGGWLEEHPFYSYQQAVNQKQQNYWTQIASYFRNYNEHLLFAGTNEVHADYGTPTNEHITVQQSYNQTFVNAVRATGGNNASRTLVVQTYNTNANFGLSYFSLPTDSASNRLMVEIHFYDPYDFTLNPNGPCLAWGAPYPQYSQCAWAQEAYVDDLFSRVKNRWVNAGVPVIIGEYAAAVRANLNEGSRRYWHEYVNRAAKSNGLKTFLWDTGNSSGLFNRNNGAITNQALLDAIRRGFNGGGGGNGIIADGTYRIVARHSGKVVDVQATAVADGSNVHQWTYYGGNSQRWTLTHLGNNVYRIIGAGSGKALEVSSTSTANGTNVDIRGYNGANNQKWTISATGGGYYRLTPVSSGGSALDVSGVSTADGANIHQWGWNGGNNQQWAFQAP